MPKKVKRIKETPREGTSSKERAGTKTQRNAQGIPVFLENTKSRRSIRGLHQ